MHPITLYVDTREDTRNRSIDKICQDLRLPFVHAKLDVGDFATDKCIMERKTIQDFYGSTISQRIFDQQDRLAKWADEHNYVAIWGISGNLLDLHNEIPIQINPEVLFGTMASIACRSRCHIFWATCDEDLIKLFYEFATKVSEGKYGTPRRLPLSRDFATNRAAHVATVLRVSTKQAEGLLNKFGSLKKILLASDSDILLVSGIGQTTLQRIRAVIGE